MEKYILGLFIVIYSLTGYGQEINKHSIGVDANYLMPYNRNATNDLNYGFSILLSEKIAFIKVSLGLDYSSMNYYYQKQSNTDIPYLYKEEYKTQYLNFPLLVSFIKYSEKKYKIDPYVGLILSTVIHYDVIDYHPNNPPLSVKDPGSPYSRAFAFRVGVNFSKSIGKQYLLNASPYLNFPLNENFVEDPKYFSPVPVNNPTFGFKLGLEYEW